MQSERAQAQLSSLFMLIIKKRKQDDLPPLPTTEITCIEEITLTTDCLCFNHPASLICKYYKDETENKILVKKEESKKLTIDSLVKILSMSNYGAMSILQFQTLRMGK